MFMDTVEAYRRRGRIKCEKRDPCWDCLRAAGLTPPFTIRDRYARRSGSGKVVIFDGTEEGFAIGDPGGIPRRRTEKSEAREEPAMKGGSEEARTHIREAVRNREAI